MCTFHVFSVFVCVCCFPSSLRRAYSWLSFLTLVKKSGENFWLWQTSPLLIRLILTTVKSFNISLDMLARHSVLFFLMREKTRSESALLCGRAQRDFMMLDSKGYLSSPVSDLREVFFSPTEHLLAPLYQTPQFQDQHGTCRILFQAHPSHQWA